MSSSIGTNRRPITELSIAKAIEELRDQLDRRLIQKGRGSFASTHEIVGIIQEETAELLEAVHDGGYEPIVAELFDIAVAAVFGAACLRAGTTDW